MRMEAVRRETERLRKKISNLPKIPRFRGRRVVHAEDWKWVDWSTLPDHYIPFMISPDSTPHDWYQDYVALMVELRDPTWGHAVCGGCAINRAHEAKKEIDREARYWEDNGGETAKEEQLRRLGEQTRLSSQKQERMQQAEWRLYNERGGANNRTCDVINYFNCPYGDEWRQLIEKGSALYKVWQHTRWYDIHWNRSHTYAPVESKWYHYDEARILDVTDFDDITKALEDGRFDRIVEEHERYMKENKHEISAL